jgi:hypothetical protein
VAPGLFAGRCWRATREKSPTFKDRDHLLAAREQAQRTRRRNGAPQEIGLGALQRGPFRGSVQASSRRREQGAGASSSFLGQRLGDEHTTLPILKWLKSSVERLSENSGTAPIRTPTSGQKGPTSTILPPSVAPSLTLGSPPAIYQTVSELDFSHLLAKRVGTPLAHPSEVDPSRHLPLSALLEAHSTPKGRL